MIADNDQLILFGEIESTYDFKKDGPRQLLPATQSTYVMAVLSVLNWARRMRSGLYGSDHRVFTDPSYPMYHSEVYRLVDLVFRDLTGRSLSCITRSSIDVAKVFVGCRKGNYKRLRDCKIIPSTVDPGSVVYGALGCIANHDGRLMKIGYTEQNLKRYLRSKRIQSDFILVASYPGGHTEENEAHLALQSFLVEGREWFAKRREVFEYMADEGWVLEEAWHREMRNF
jgi:hypothetical protein